MKKDKGFTLVEVIISTFILSVMSAALFPVFIKVYDERVSILQERIADENINHAIQTWLYESQLPSFDFVERNTLYRWEVVLIEENKLEICLTWSSKNGRDYEKCRYAKK